jgi:hypothetical protein
MTLSRHSHTPLQVGKTPVWTSASVHVAKKKVQVEAVAGFNLDSHRLSRLSQTPVLLLM